MSGILIGSKIFRRGATPSLFSLKPDSDHVEMGATVTRASAASYIADEPLLFGYTPGDSLAGATFTRASTASYTGSQTFFDLAADNVPADRTFTRASTAAYVNADGILKFKPSGGLRDTHYINGRRTILLEGQRTNLLLQSQAYDHASWDKYACTITPNAGIAPDGTLTADKLTDTVISIDHYTRQLVTVAAGAHTKSVYAKAGTLGWVLIQFADGGTNPYAFFNVENGTIGTAVGGAIPRITPAPNGFFRCELTFTLAGGLIGTNVFGTPSNGVNSYPGGTGTVYLWGAQLEAAPFASSYIPTTTAAVTRAADNLKFPYTDTPQEATMYLRFVELGPENPSAPVLIGDAGGTRWMGWLQNPLGYQSYHISIPTNLATPVPVPGNLVEHRYTLSASGQPSIHQSINGGAESTGGPTGVTALQPAWGFPIIRVGNYNDNYFAFMAVERLIVARGVRDMDYFRNL